MDNTIYINVADYNIKLPDLITIGSVDTTWDINDYSVGSDTFEIDDSWIKELEEESFWKSIRDAAEHNPTLQEALERVKVVYYLSKEDGNSKT